ncbi:MAG TPA: phenylalanine--tRNA ligase subunit beta [Candidatus Nitrosotalea sp.]|nr:phenylalanine--tRNA ligase subunit beta [Candidatus Nitrosotalea sp.]
MRVSFEWLCHLAGLEDLTPQRAAEALTMAGFNVESVEIQDLSAIRIGRVISQEPHPSSQKPLFVHQVDLGDEVRQIIAGVANAVPGSLVPVALPGVTVPSGITVRDGRIAGLAARGMLCSAAELKLADDHSGILLLESGEPGQSLDRIYPLEALLEVDVTPNRPDCLCHLGLARELAAALGRPLRRDFMPAFTGGVEPPGKDLIQIEIQAPDLCRRYIGAVVGDLKPGPSPAWMQRRLRAAGVRPISNLVDVTNYVLLEYGQPLHVFDLERVRGARIEVRRARKGESLNCLDGEIRALNPQMLVIADAEGPLALAGVMGGQESAVGEATSTVLLEAATFDGVNIRATSRSLRLRTEASARFEKGISPELALAGARRAVQLLNQVAQGQVHTDWPDVYPSPQEPLGVRFQPAQIDAILGVHVPLEEMEDILQRLDFQVRIGDEGEWEVLPPVFRLDVAIVPDVAEEVGRIFGYERVPARLPGARRLSWRPPGPSLERRLDPIRVELAAGGLSEVVCPALVSGRTLRGLGLGEAAIAILNPVSDEQDTLRTALLPSLLQVAIRNRDAGRAEIGLFELARVYHAHPEHPLKQPDELESLAAWRSAPADAGASRLELLRLRGLLERALASVTTAEVLLEPGSAPLFHPGRCAQIRIGGRPAGHLGEIHPRILSDAGLGGRAVALELRIAPVLENAPRRRFRALPRFPAIERDLAVVVAEEVGADALLKTAREEAGALLESLGVFDEYRGSQLPPGRKSVALKLVFRSSERTLTDDEADRALDQVKAALGARWGAGFRA